MPRVSRHREIDAPASKIWNLITDPDHLPRWWPRATRVEDILNRSNPDRMRWTLVMKSDRGNVVRADFTGTLAKRDQRFGWRQDVRGTDFDKWWSSIEYQVDLEPTDGGTRVEITSTMKARGLSKLGGTLMRSGTGRTLDQALEGLDNALGGTT